ncbi:MAG TPA: hypothetical protein VEX15_21570 [Nocardioidaceae bacterium]|nr:hypothetical protein [Nocardioidaceae bacterium]
MPVTDQQVATLRPYITGDAAEYKRLISQLDRKTDQEGWGALVAAAFLLAADQRFSSAREEIVDFVGSVRARSDRLADEIDPRTAERLIEYAALGEGDVSDVGAGVQHATQLLLLAAMVYDSQYDEVQLDKFIAKARSIANQWID